MLQRKTSAAGTMAATRFARLSAALAITAGTMAATRFDHR
jgi:hypothetical protein